MSTSPLKRIERAELVYHGFTPVSDELDWMVLERDDLLIRFWPKSPHSDCHVMIQLPPEHGWEPRLHQHFGSNALGVAAITDYLFRKANDGATSPHPDEDDPHRTDGNGVRGNGPADRRADQAPTGEVDEAGDEAPASDVQATEDIQASAGHDEGSGGGSGSRQPETQQAGEGEPTQESVIGTCTGLGSCETVTVPTSPPKEDTPMGLVMEPAEAPKPAARSQFDFVQIIEQVKALSGSLTDGQEVKVANDLTTSASQALMDGLRNDLYVHTTADPDHDGARCVYAREFNEGEREEREAKLAARREAKAAKAASEA